MKKLLIAALAAAALSMPCAYADSAADEAIRIVACYDEDGKLVFADRVRDGESIPEEYADFETKVFELKTAPAPSATPEAPKATEAPAPTATPKPTLHPAYEKAADASSAFAVVKKVVTALNDNNEEIYAVTCLYQGQEITVQVAQDIIIKSAPDAFRELKGSDALALEAGDVIYYETNLAGSRVRGIYLIHRPANILEGNFYSYFTASGKAGGMWSVVPFGGKAPSGRYAYAFGIIKEKYDNTLTLYPVSGIADDAIDIDFTSDTVTYICDMEGKTQLEIARPAGIKKSRISKPAIDEDDNVTFNTDHTYSIAVIRLVDDTATDIVVYQNVEF